MKDPAFLFYSKDFYEGTRMMLPEERACYLDLLIYQHQNGVIPNDIKRVMMYCSGCKEETILSVLNQKFNQTVDGWLNQKLNHVVDERSKHKPKKIAAGTLAGLISSSNLNKKIAEKIKKSFQINDFIVENNEVTTDENVIKSKVREWFKNIVNHMVNNLAIENAIANVNTEDGKEGLGEKPKTNNPPEEPFDRFRKLYPGTKQGLKQEFENFKKKHNDWLSVIPLLQPALENQQKWRKEAKEHDAFVPEWPHLQTWINQRRWEQELNFNFEKKKNNGTKTNQGIDENIARSVTNGYARGLESLKG